MFSDNVEIRRHEGPQALRGLVVPLRSADLLPAPFVGMDPEYLAEGFEGNDPVAMVAYLKDRPVAYMPYVVRRTSFRLEFGPKSFGRLPCRQLRLFGYAANDDGHAPILDSFFKSLLENKTWHLAQIFDLPVNSPLAEYVTQPAFDGGRSTSLMSKTSDTIQVRIEEDFDSYLKRQFSKKTRYNLRREVRLLEAVAPGQVAARVYRSADQVTDFLRDAERIARQSYQWKLFGFDGLRATPSLIRKLSYLAEHERWRSYILFIRDVPAAFCYATIYWGGLYYETIGYDLRFAKLNPGKVLLYKILQDLHECRVVDQLEFGRGSTEYKRLFANSSQLVLDVSLFRYDLYSQILRLLAGTADAGYHRLQPLIHLGARAIKRRFRGWGLASSGETTASG